MTDIHCRYTESIPVILDMLREVRHMLGLSDRDYCNNTRTNLIPGSLQVYLTQCKRCTEHLRSRNKHW